MNWSFDDDRPIYSQIIEHMKNFIVSNDVKAGEKLPSVRELASQAGVNPNTMQRALSELESTGLVYSNRTSGRFITEDENIIHTLKSEIANNNIQSFLINMKKIGYEKEETIELIKNFKEGEN